MPIVEVTMYRAVCNGCGSAMDMGEYYAWAERDQVAEMINDGDDVLLDDGRVFCWECVPADICRNARGPHIIEDGECVECGIAPPVGVADIPEGEQ